MYPSAMRQHIFNIRATENLTIKQTAKRFNIGVATLSRWIKNPEPKLKRNKPCPKINMEQLKQDIIDRPDDYQHERAQRFGVSRHGIYAALKRLGITRKKTLSHPKACEEKKRIFCQQRDEYIQQSKHIVYIDESGLSRIHCAHMATK